MSFFKRAWIAVKRRKTRNIIMLVLLIAISTLIFTGLAIQNATKEASTLARQKLGSKITLSFDYQSAMKKETEDNESSSNKKIMKDIEYKAITEEMAKQIAENEHVYDYNYVVNTSGFASSFDAIKDSQSSKIEEAEGSMKDKISSFNESADKMKNNMPEGMDKIDMANISMADITIVGVSSLSLEENFKSGDYTLTDGEEVSSSSEENTVVIEKTLAEANEINIGDSIKIKATSEGSDIELKVIGIYDAGNVATEGMFSGMSSSLAYNKIFVNYKTAISIKSIATEENENSDSIMVRGATQSSDGIDSVVFYIDDPENVDSVIEYSKSTDIDFDTYSISANDEEYESMIKPIENVASFSKILVVIVILAGAAIVTLILMLWIKERTYETGVLLSLGEGKHKVVLQYITEVFMIAIIAFTISIFVGGIVSQKVGDVLLSQELETTSDSSDMKIDKETSQISRMPMGEKAAENSSTTEVIDEIDVSVSFDVIMKVLGLEAAVVIIATAIPSIYIFRYNPKKILSTVG